MPPYKLKILKTVSDRKKHGFWHNGSVMLLRGSAYKTAESQVLCEVPNLRVFFCVKICAYILIVNFWKFVSSVSLFCRLVCLYCSQIEKAINPIRHQIALCAFNSQITIFSCQYDFHFFQVSIFTHFCCKITLNTVKLWVRIINKI